MKIPGEGPLSLAARSGLSTLFAALLSAGGCSFLVSSELADKREETTGAGGGGGQGGAGATSAQVSSGPSVASSTGVVGSSAAGSTDPGGMMCSKDFADCDGKPENGCETNIKTDRKNCGACKHECEKSETCEESACE